MHPSTRFSSMSLVAEGPEIQVSGRRGSSRATACGTEPTTCSGTRTTQMWWSGISVIRRRPWSGLPSRTSVPVSATATAQPVTTESTRSSSAAVLAASSATRVTSAPVSASHAPSSPGGTSTDRAPRPASSPAISADSSGTPAHRCTRAR